MPGRTRKRLFAIPPALAALVSSEAGAQSPPHLPALPPSTTIPTRPAVGVGFAPPPPVAAPDFLAPSAAVCTPNHCVHKTSLAKWRCKRKLQEKFLGFPEEFERPPLGAALYAANIAQVSNGEAASMTFYEYDFDHGTERLNARGLSKAESLAPKLASTFHAVVVERTGRPVDDLRREVVFSVLSDGPIPVPPTRVVVGRPISNGLRGEEATIHRVNELIRAEQANPPVNQGSTVNTPSSTPSN